MNLKLCEYRNIGTISISGIKLLIEEDYSEITEIVMGKGEAEGIGTSNMKTPLIQRCLHVRCSHSFSSSCSINIRRITPVSKGNKSVILIKKKIRLQESIQLNILRTLRFSNIGWGIGCNRSIRIWKLLNSALIMCFRLEFADCDLIHFMCKDPDDVNYVSIYLRCFHKIKSRIKLTSEVLETFERKFTDLTNNTEILLSTIKAHQDKTIKFKKQMSNVSANLAESNYRNICHKNIKAKLFTNIRFRYLTEAISIIGNFASRPYWTRWIWSTMCEDYLLR